ncbi:hypothetical protein PHLGIDRAFT_292251 [Phlebiopsis gigantea 11061_1 CR5-6]|uniref:DUF4219 domain-containing protein n=1 Tax=Phlebiopsis gigantea (strain 11061_1 CR5-6) TaxID=745531 RepID=A0A0C3S0I5_PHLG1|nr:hypothetical protein PHLGIDRAFT_292251 [Phlebiopsis gigantea 11061_1 CR5-6]
MAALNSLSHSNHFAGTYCSCIDIAPLRGTDNYFSWSIHMEDLLFDFGLWGYVAGGIKAPVPKDEKDTDAQGELEKWQKKDRSALAAIRYRVSDSILVTSGLRSAKTSKDAWDKVSLRYKKRGKGMH